MMLSNHLILYRPVSLLSSVFLSIRVFFSESALHILGLEKNAISKKKKKKKTLLSNFSAAL